MRASRKVTLADLIFSDAVAFHGQTAGNIVVIDGAVLEMHGICGKDLIVEKGGKAIVTGVVGGTAINNGGHLIVKGLVRDIQTNSGRTDV